MVYNVSINSHNMILTGLDLITECIELNRIKVHLLIQRNDPNIEFVANMSVFALWSIVFWKSIFVLIEYNVFWKSVFVVFYEIVCKHKYCYIY